MLRFNHFIIAIALLLMAACSLPRRLATPYRPVDQKIVELAQGEEDKDGIILIKDSLEIAYLKKEISAIMAERDSANEVPLSVQLKKLARAYKSGSDSAKVQIQKLLQEGDTQIKNGLYDRLGPDYYTPDDFTIEDSIIRAITINDIGDSVFQQGAIQIAGIYNFPGALDIFEELLLEGQSPHYRRLMYWLAREGESGATFDLLKNQILNEAFPSREEYWVYLALYNFSQSSDTSISKKALDLCIRLYDSGRFDADFKKDKKNYFSSSKGPESTVKALLHSNDERVIPIAKALKEIPYKSSQCDRFLMQFYGPDYWPVIKAGLIDTATTHFYFPIAAEFYALYPNQEIPESLIEVYDRSNTINYSYQLIFYLHKMNALYYLENLERFIQESSKLKDAQDEYFWQTRDPYEIIKDMVNFGLLRGPADSSRIPSERKMSVTMDGHGFHAVHDCIGIDLKHSKALIEEPLLEESLAGQFKNVSRDYLDEVIFYEYVWPLSDQHRSWYLIALWEDRAYLIHREASTPFVNFDQVELLINRILIDQNRVERFVPIYDYQNKKYGYNFGPPEGVKAYRKKYRID